MQIWKQTKLPAFPGGRIESDAFAAAAAAVAVAAAAAVTAAAFTTTMTGLRACLRTLLRSTFGGHSLFKQCAFYEDSLTMVSLIGRFYKLKA